MVLMILVGLIMNLGAQRDDQRVRTYASKVWLKFQQNSVVQILPGARQGQHPIVWFRYP